MRVGGRDPEKSVLLQTKDIRVGEIERGEDIVSDSRCFERRGARCNGPVRLVDFVLFDTRDLVGDDEGVEVEDTVDERDGNRTKHFFDWGVLVQE